jgi:hypothetical protein
LGRKRKKERNQKAVVPEGGKEERQKPSGKGKPIISPKAGLEILGLLSVGVLVLVWISAPEGASWISNLTISLVIVASIWLVAAFSYTVSKWLRSR